MSGYGSWNTAGDIGRPLNALDSYASGADADAEFVLEIQSLMYEQGARCSGGTTTGECGVPSEDVSGTASLGSAFTITARAHSGIQRGDCGFGGFHIAGGEWVGGFAERGGASG